MSKYPEIDQIASMFEARPDLLPVALRKAYVAMRERIGSASSEERYALGVALGTAWRAWKESSQ